MGETSGWVASGWEDVRRAFDANFEGGNEIGAAFSAYHRGEKVVDLWGGVADNTTGRKWEEDTMVLVFSATKGVAAMCANRLAQEGVIDVDAPVTTYWPEFGDAGKDAVTVAHLLSHRAGLPWVDAHVSIDDMLTWDPVVRALEHQQPVWPPGTEHGYHATTYGWLVGEVVRRVTGKSIGTYLRDTVAGPLGADFFIGVPAAEDHRVARLVSFIESIAAGRPLTMGGGGSGDASGPDLGQLAALATTYFAPDGPLYKALDAPGGLLSDESLWSTPRLRAAEIPSANGVTTARGLACLYGACVSEVATTAGERFRIMSPAQLDAALVPRTIGPDRVLLGLDIQWGLGFMVNLGLIAAAGLGGPRSFGHFGMGGSVGWADPDAELATAYVMNRMDLGLTGDARGFTLVQACQESARRQA